MKNKIIFNILKKYKFLLFLIFIFQLFFDLVSVYLLPYILKIIGNKYETDLLTTNIAIFLVFLYSFFSSIEKLINATILPKLFYKSVDKIEITLREKLFSYAISHSINFFNNNIVGIITTRINNVAKNIQFIIFRISEIISGIIIFLLTIFLYFKINLYLGYFLILWTLIFYITQYYLGKLNYNSVKNITKERNNISGIITDDFVNILNIKSYSKQKREATNVKKQSLIILQKESKLLWIKTLTNIVLFILSSCLTFFVIGISFMMVLEEKITIGTFLFLCQNIIMSSFVIKNIFNNSSELITKLSESKEGLNEILKPIDIQNKENSKKLENVVGKVSIKNLSFSYNLLYNKSQIH